MRTASKPLAVAPRTPKRMEMARRIKMAVMLKVFPG
ncbi:MAG: hypothetical protein ACI89G_001180 [Minisyncoccia bacterium]|jgi:hypothetical protein